MSSLGARRTLTLRMAVFCSGKMPWHAFSISLPAPWAGGPGQSVFDLSTSDTIPNLARYALHSLVCITTFNVLPSTTADLVMLKG